MSNEMELLRASQVLDATGAAGTATVSEQEMPPAPPALSVEVTLAAKLSLADFQNAVPLLRELTVESTLKSDTVQLELLLTSTPAFVKPKTWRLDAIRAGVCLEELVALAALVVNPAASDDENLVAMARELGLLQLRAASRGRLEQALLRFRAGKELGG